MANLKAILRAFDVDEKFHLEETDIGARYTIDPSTNTSSIPESLAQTQLLGRPITIGSSFPNPNPNPNHWKILPGVYSFRISSRAPMPRYT